MNKTFFVLNTNQCIYTEWQVRTSTHARHSCSLVEIVSVVIVAMFEHFEQRVADISICHSV